MIDRGKNVRRGIGVSGAALAAVLLPVRFEIRPIEKHKARQG